MKKLDEYSKLIDQNQNNPSFLCVLQNEIAADYGYCASQMTKVKIEKASAWPLIKFREEKPYSDSLTDQLWAQEPSGKLEIQLKYKMATLEKYMSAIKSYCFVAGQESAGNF